MKFKKIAPLILTLPLLSSCGSIKINEPTFEDYSNKVEYKDYASELTKAQLSNPLITQATSVYSISASQTKSTGSSFNLKLDNKIETDSKIKLTNSLEYDSVNNLMEIKQENARESSSTRGKRKSSSESTLKSDVFYQSQDDNHSYIIDLDANEYTDEGAKDNYATVLNGYAKTSTLSLVNVDFDVATYLLLSDEEKAKYSFYNDNNVFTLVYEDNTEEEINDSADSTKVIATKKTNTIKKTQINITSTLIKYLCSEVTSYTIEFNKDGYYQYLSVFNTVKAGDKATGKEEYYVESNIEFKDVTLSKKDLSKYTLTND